MPVFKFVVSDVKNRRTVQVATDQSKAAAVVGKRIGDEVSGDLIGFSGYILQITGGTDKDGFPMHSGISGSAKRKVLLSEPPCYHPNMKGQRKRKTVRGNTISNDIVQINAKVVKYGARPFEEIAKEFSAKVAAPGSEEAAKKEEPPAFLTAKKDRRKAVV